MDDLKEIQIDDISQTISILNEAKAGASDVQKNLISAQVHALSAMENHSIIESSVDSIIICLKKSNESAQTATDKIVVQEETCLILQGMMYFAYANLLSVQKNTKDKSDELMKISKKLLHIIYLLIALKFSNNHLRFS